MKTKNKTFRTWLESLTLREREKNQLLHFIQEKAKLEELSDNELFYQYINVKALYEHKKSIFSFFLATILLSVLVGLWKEVYLIFMKMLELIYKNQTPELAEVALMIFGAVFSVVCMTLILIFVVYLRSVYHVHKRLILLEEILRKREK